MDRGLFPLFLKTPLSHHATIWLVNKKVDREHFPFQSVFVIFVLYFIINNIITFLLRGYNKTNQVRFKGDSSEYDHQSINVMCVHKWNQREGQRGGGKFSPPFCINVNLVCAPFFFDIYPPPPPPPTICACKCEFVFGSLLFCKYSILGFVCFCLIVFQIMFNVNAYAIGCGVLATIEQWYPTRKFNGTWYPTREIL